MVIKGRYMRGCNKAHFSSAGHGPIFGCPMIGTFNVRINKSITDFTPSIVSKEYGRQYWKIIINGKHEAWAFRWDGSKMPTKIWELVSKEPLPNGLKKGIINLEILGE